jgi:hypothetical protein
VGLFIPLHAGIPSEERVVQETFTGYLRDHRGGEIIYRIPDRLHEYGAKEDDEDSGPDMMVWKDLDDDDDIRAFFDTVRPWDDRW